MCRWKNIFTRAVRPAQEAFTARISELICWSLLINDSILLRRRADEVAHEKYIIWDNSFFSAEVRLFGVVKLI